MSIEGSMSPTALTPELLKASYKRVAQGDLGMFIGAIRDGTLDPLFLPLTALRLSEECRVALHHAQFEYVGQLVREQRSYFMRRLALHVHLNEMQLALRQWGLDLGMFFNDPVSTYLHHALQISNDKSPDEIATFIMREHTRGLD